MEEGGGRKKAEERELRTGGRKEEEGRRKEEEGRRKKKEEWITRITIHTYPRVLTKKKNIVRNSTLISTTEVSLKQ